MACVAHVAYQRPHCCFVLLMLLMLLLYARLCCAARRFDSLLDMYGVYKVETIGDCCECATPEPHACA
jgi:hypothetical protein